MMMMISQSQLEKKWCCSLRTALRTALCESIRYQAKSEQNVRQDLIPRVRHGEAALCTPVSIMYGSSFACPDQVWTAWSVSRRKPPGEAGWWPVFFTSLRWAYQTRSRLWHSSGLSETAVNIRQYLHSPALRTVEIKTMHSQICTNHHHPTPPPSLPPGGQSIFLFVDS